MGLALTSEQLNTLAAKHWRMFSQEQYFDSHGLFISVVYSGPLLFNCFLMTVLWLWTAGKMLIVVKRGQLKEQRKREAEEKKSQLNEVFTFKQTVLTVMYYRLFKVHGEEVQSAK